MKKAAFMAVTALAGAVMAADVKVGTFKFVATGTDAGKIEVASVAGLGDLATMDTITLAKVTDAGTLAGKSEVAKTDLASGVQTSLGKADTAVQSVTVETADNGGISVSVDGGTAVSTALGTAATTASTAYATAAQGAKADTAVQSVTVTTADNGGISVSVDGGTAVSTSLGTAATTAASAYATAAQGTKADSALQQADVALASADNGGISVTVGTASITNSLGTAATTASTAYATAAQGTKADSALQQTDVAISAGSNGGISVKVGSAQAANSLGALATKNTVSADVIDVELGDYYLVDGANTGDIDVMKRASN